MALPPRIRDHLTLPAIAAPMFLCSGVALAAEVCKAGLIGSLTRNHCRDIEELEMQLKAVTERLAPVRDLEPAHIVGPLAVNITPHFNDAELRAHMALCRRYGVSIIITSVGNPTATAPVIHDAGLLHFHDATNLRFAEKAVAAGVDGIIAIGAGGGGHSGTLSHLAFIPQVRAMFDGVVVLAGAVSAGAVIRAAEVLGADLAYLGTRFIATQESDAPDEYKAMLVEGGTNDVLYSDGVNGMSAMWLKASLRKAGLDPEHLPKVSARSTDHLPADIKPWRDIWSAGQGIGMIADLPSVATLVQRLREEYAAACAIRSFADAAAGNPTGIPI
jgi:nitronate monooxygenase